MGTRVLLNQLGTIGRDRQRWAVVAFELRPESDLFAGLARLAREAVLTLAPPAPTNVEVLVVLKDRVYQLEPCVPSAAVE
jgi:hypothetical protein